MASRISIASKNSRFSATGRISKRVISSGGVPCDRHIPLVNVRVRATTRIRAVARAGTGQG